MGKETSTWGTKTRRAESHALSNRTLSRAGMQTLRALFIMALAPLVAGFGSFTPDAITPVYTPLCSSTVPLLPLEAIVAAVSTGGRQDPRGQCELLGRRL